MSNEAALDQNKESINIAIAGFGTVGSAVFNLLQDMSEEIERRLGESIRVVAVGARRSYPGVDFSGVQLERDVTKLALIPEVDIVLELMGGTDTAKELIIAAIANGKHVVTANKALLAEMGEEIFAAARQAGVVVAFEAAVAGGIPFIKALREGLAANRIDWLAGIINGTGNFILTEMLTGQRAFDEVLSEAQALGYAEADPTFDVEGIDAAHKLTLMAAIAFGIPLQYEKLTIEGISEVSLADIDYAEQLGFKIKHLGIAKRHENSVELRVHPTLIPKSSLLASVDGVMNAVMVQAHAVGPTLYYGAGAGGMATASAVVADVMDVVRQINLPKGSISAPLGYERVSASLPVMSKEEFLCAYYLRLSVADNTGALAKIATILSEAGIGIEAILQKETAGDHTPLVILTHLIEEASVKKAISVISQLPDVKAPIQMLRVDYLDKA